MIRGRQLLEPRLLFDVAVIILFAIFVYEARDWRLQARLYPWVVGIPMLVLAAVHLVRELGRANDPSASQTIETPARPETPVDFRFTSGIDPALARRRTLTMFAWILGFFAGIWVLGFAIAVPAFVFLYLKIQSAEGWGVSLALTAAAWLTFWALFDRLLRLPFPDGMIFSWVGSP